MRRFDAAFGWLSRLSANTSARTKTFLAYGAAGAIIWFVSRGIPLAAMTNAIGHAHLALFLCTSAGALAVWLLRGDAAFLTPLSSPTSISVPAFVRS